METREDKKKVLFIVSCIIMVFLAVVMIITTIQYTKTMREYGSNIEQTTYSVTTPSVSAPKYDAGGWLVSKGILVVQKNGLQIEIFEDTTTGILYMDASPNSSTKCLTPIYNEDGSLQTINNNTILHKYTYSFGFGED